MKKQRICPRPNCGGTLVMEREVDALGRLISRPHCLSCGREIGPVRPHEEPQQEGIINYRADYASETLVALAGLRA